MFLSIVIPTLNEEDYLLSLLESIKKQDFSDYEIIISDAGSTDKTISVARKYNCKTVLGGLPARGKNEGVKAAEGSLLLILDADTILPEGFLRENIEEFRRRNLDIGGVLLASIDRSPLLDFFLDIFYNFPILLMEKMLPHTAIAIFIKKEIFDEVKGFDEDIVLAEDHNMGRRAGKIGKYGVLKGKKVLTSKRRFEQDGWIRTYVKYVYAEFHMIFKGPLRRGGIIKYEFDHYSEEDKK